MSFVHRAFLLGGGVLTLLLLIGAGTPGWTDEPCAPLISNKCGTCHFVNYICPRIEKGKGRFYWRGIVKDMVKEGMVATDQQQKRMIDCLASPDREVKGLCSNR